MVREPSSSSAEAEAEITATELRDRGLDVIGLGFGRVREDALEAMFGVEFSSHVALDDLADELVDQFDRLYDHQPIAI